VVYDYTGWLTVDGRRFTAFLPLGSKIVLENEAFFLAHAFQWSYEEVKRMPSSARHRFVKMQEESVRQNQPGNSSGTMPAPSSPTGLAPKAGSKAVPISYNP